MPVFDTRGLLRRCPDCDRAVSDDAVRCAFCGGNLDGATREDATAGPADEAAARPGVSGAVFGSAGGLFSLGSGNSGAAAAVTGFLRGLVQSLGEAGVKLLGLKTGASAIDENPWAGSTGAGALVLLRRRVYRLTFPWRTGLRETSLIPLYRSFASYAESGIGFHDALARLEKNELSPAMRRILKEIRADLFEGATLGEAFGRHEYLFDPLAVALIEVGESLGTIADNMRQLVEIIEEKQAIRESIARRMVQPIVLVLIANYVLTIPVFMTGGLFAYLATVVPPTLVFIGLAVCAVVVLPVLGSAMGPRLRDRIVLELPAFGTIARTNALARFARALGSAIAAGVEIEKSLRMAARATGNTVVEGAVLAALPFVKERGLAEGLERGGVLPPPVAAVLAHGEATGKIAPTLLQIAKDARARAARGITVLGGIFAFLVLALSAVYAVLRTLGTVMSTLSGGVPGLPGSPGFDPFNDPRLPRR